MVSTENKHSFFSLTIDVAKNVNNSYQLENLDNSVDLIFSLMKVKSVWYKFFNKSAREVVYIFKTEDRKRKGQLVNYCQKILPASYEYQVMSLSKFSFDNDLGRFQNNDNFELVHKPIRFADYTANDIALFHDKKNWYPWQKQIYDKVFNDDGSFKTADPRHIISVIDTKGNTGKSSWWKFWFYNYPDEIARIGYGSASQLRSGAVNIGKKKLYIVDLTRSKAYNDKEEDLLSALEDIKNGFLTNSMYGSGRTLVMEPPHVIVSSNYPMPYELLSEDRWEIYEINSRKRLVEKNPKTIKTLKTNSRKKTSKK